MSELEISREQIQTQEPEVLTQGTGTDNSTSRVLGFQCRGGGQTRSPIHRMAEGVMWGGTMIK